ncbi:F-box/kelch-repeat protein At3g06240-like [Papaver somniferum]|uniref:F-box/kelch-repeat protein At3g06240-like n=1 Tax=Papaver somniferum TaxID=3469 RepID=UPI000E6F99E2|nr:F-box/kelch-repeat protein At3g06240-like [Papaver somniferum]
MSISSLPEEIQEKVILKLPVKSISTCKCVCKLWCNLISSPEFIKYHLKLPLCLNINQLISFLVVNKSSLCYVEYDFENDEQISQKPTKELFNLGRLGYFEDVGGQDIVIVGSCNGLVCLATKIDKFLCGHVYICNPITRECLELPSLVPTNKDYKDHGYAFMLYGFGYLSSSNEYKVVRISYSGNKIYSGKVDVYTIGDGRGWRYRGEITTELLHRSSTQGILVDGALFWIDECSAGPLISVFDLTDEKLYMLSVPPASPSWGNYKLGVLTGQLCFFQATTYDSSIIWLLGKNIHDSDVKEQGGKDRHSPWIWSKESGKDEHSPWIWRKGPTVTLEGIVRYRPLTTAKNGDILFLYREKWNQAETKNVIIRFDPKTSDSNELGDLGLPLPGFGKATIHVNSYISLKLLGEENVFARL